MRRGSILSMAGIAATIVVAPGLSTSARSSLASMQNTTAPPLREAYAALPGVRLWYVDSGGSGVPVIFMHAATGSVRSWEYQVPAFTKAGYRFIACDRRGWGRTTID